MAVVIAAALSRMPSQDTFVEQWRHREMYCLLFGSYFGRKVFQIRETSWNTLGARDTGETSWEKAVTVGPHVT